jgi:hypothetical protein
MASTFFMGPPKLQAAQREPPMRDGVPPDYF